MSNYTYLKASDGTGMAVLTHIESNRLVGATVLNVDSVDNFPSDHFILVTGTVGANGFITAATMCQMLCHVLAGDIIIDGFVPGFTDVGNTSGQVGIIKQTSHWADSMVDMALVSHNTDGTIKNDAITTDAQFTDNVDPVKRASELFYDYIASGALIAGLSYGVTLTASLSAGVCYINGYRQLITAVASRAYTASKDTYVDLLYNASGTATVVYTEVANNAVSPALAANSIRLAIVVTGATIVAAASINQGQPTALLPILGAPMQFTETNGNLINPRDPQRRVIGYRQGSGATNSAAYVDIAAFNFLCNVPTGRKVQLHFESSQMYVTGAVTTGIQMYDGTAAIAVQDSNQNMGNTVAQAVKVESLMIQPPASGARNYKIQGKAGGGATLNIPVNSCFYAVLV